MNKSEDLTSSGDVDFAFDEDWNSSSQVRVFPSRPFFGIADNCGGPSCLRRTWTT